MRSFFILFLFLPSLFSRADTQTKVIQLIRDDHNRMDKFVFINPNDSNYIKFIEHHQDMGIRVIDQFDLKTGVPDGLYEVYVNGRLDREGAILHGRKQGKWINWYGTTDPSCKIENWVMDTLQGYSVYYEKSGALLRSFHYYINGEPVFTESLYDNRVVGRGVLSYAQTASWDFTDSIYRVVTKREIMEEHQYSGRDTEKIEYYSRGEMLRLTLYKGKTVTWDYRRADPYYKIKMEVSEIILDKPLTRKTLGNDFDLDSGSYVCELSEIPASFPGGETALKKFLKENLRYPEEGREYGRGIEGTVYVSFRVLKEGSISNITLSRKFIPSFDEEALRLVRLFPKFIPAQSSGKQVDSYVCVPIRFREEE